MARYSEHDRALIDAVVERWREECLVADGSLLYPSEEIWSAAVIDDLYSRFNENLIEGSEESFEEKFQAQRRGRAGDLPVRGRGSRRLFPCSRPER